MRDRVIGGLAVREWGDPAQAGILLWPGLSSSGAYFDPLASALPWRGVAVDPPGSGGSAPLGPCTLDRLVDVSRDVAEVSGCRAVVGHSLGAYVAIGLAANPPAELRAAVLIDGGFLSAEDYVELGMPVKSGPAQLITWMEANGPRFPDWDTAFGQLAAMIGGEVTPALQGYVRDVFAEVDGEVRQRARPDGMADLLLAVVDDDARARAERIEIPTLLIACGEPAERRAMRERAWSALAQASPLIELQVVEGWSHNPILQDPERASSMIVDWLQARL
ncbi:MAG TPA: alpha/beta hydrolase [Solirubrobacteraceae bacterium]|nr:alpha/beta hydrolase [Solirubrobacteraceae bacterium]